MVIAVFGVKGRKVIFCYLLATWLDQTLEQTDIDCRWEAGDQCFPFHTLRNCLNALPEEVLGRIQMAISHTEKQTFMYTSS